jgi:hypothetical protein
MPEQGSHSARDVVSERRAESVIGGAFGVFWWCMLKTQAWGGFERQKARDKPHEKSTLNRGAKCFFGFLVGPAGVEPTTNGLKE